jgi:uncharacterized membrane protein YqaE (UPF0057 family)
MPNHEELKAKILKDDYSLIDKILYGGLGYGYFCIPSYFFKVIFTSLFPPLGILIHYFGRMKSSFPFITSTNIKNLLYHIDEFIYSFILTMLFYVPGLIYTIKIVFNKNNDDKSKFKNTKSQDENEKDGSDDESSDDESSDDGSSDDENEDDNVTNLENLKQMLID